jgi:hypothetical protein
VGYLGNVIPTEIEIYFKQLGFNLIRGTDGVAWYEEFLAFVPTSSVPNVVTTRLSAGGSVNFTVETEIYGLDITYYDTMEEAEAHFGYMLMEVELERSSEEPLHFETEVMGLNAVGILRGKGIYLAIAPDEFPDYILNFLDSVAQSAYDDFDGSSLIIPQSHWDVDDSEWLELFLSVHPNPDSVQFVPHHSWGGVTNYTYQTSTYEVQVTRYLDYYQASVDFAEFVNETLDGVIDFEGDYVFGRIGNKYYDIGLFDEDVVIFVSNGELPDYIVEYFKLLGFEVKWWNREELIHSDQERSIELGGIVFELINPDEYMAVYAYIKPRYRVTLFIHTEERWAERDFEATVWWCSQQSTETTYIGDNHVSYIRAHTGRFNEIRQGAIIYTTQVRTHFNLPDYILEFFANLGFELIQ